MASSVAQGDTCFELRQVGTTLPRAVPTQRPRSSPLASTVARLAVALVAAIALVAVVAVEVGFDPPTGPAVATSSGTSPEGTASGGHSGGPVRPHIRAPSALLVDLRSGRELFARHAGRRRPIASLAKIMTALVVLQHARLSEVVTVSRRATRAAPIDVGLRRGERMTVRNLLYGLLLWSGNDTAVALAEHVGGSVRGFLGLMNDEARTLGLRRTRFASPNGLNDRGYSTARDVAVLARVAMSDRVFASFVATTRHRIPGPRTQVHRLRNLNAMLARYRGATGVKTGYTRAAGTCVVASASRAGHGMLAVVLGDPSGDSWRSAYRDATRLLNYGFALERAGGPAKR